MNMNFWGFFWAFYAEIQDSRQKWRENNFCEKSPADYADTLQGSEFCQNRSISHRYWDKLVFVFYAEIQDGHQKWQETEFWEELPVDSADNLWVKNFVKIALSRTVLR